MSPIVLRLLQLLFVSCADHKRDHAEDVYKRQSYNNAVKYFGFKLDEVK